jgi:CRP-like cAMP-binding protein
MARTISQCQTGHKIFSLGEPAEAIFYIQIGRVKITVTSKRGREAVVAILGPSDFFGEGCISGQPVRMATATAIAPSSILRIEKSEMLRVLQAEHALSGLFISHLLTRNIRIEEDLVDQLFNSTEKRLARALLLLPHSGGEGKLESVVPEISQQILAAMIGTTRSRVNFFMNKFRKLGFIEYNGGLQVHSSLLNMALNERD